MIDLTRVAWRLALVSWRPDRSIGCLRGLGRPCLTRLPDAVLLFLGSDRGSEEEAMFLRIRLAGSGL